MIVMFNMLVAIAGEIYTNFTANQESVANAVYSDMLYELELFFFWNRCCKKKKSQKVAD